MFCFRDMVHRVALSLNIYGNEHVFTLNRILCKENTQMFLVARGFLENKRLVNTNTLYKTNLFTHKTQNLIITYQHYVKAKPLKRRQK